MRETMKNETGEYDEQTGYVSDVIIQQKQGRGKQIRKTDMPNLDYTFRKIGLQIRKRSTVSCLPKERIRILLRTWIGMIRIHE